MLREYAPGDKRLVAYLVSNGKIAEKTLQDLPENSTAGIHGTIGFCRVESIATQCQRQDGHKSLPPPGIASRNRSFVAPRTALENELAAIWCKALGIEQLGIHDNFFAVGGHSLLAAQTIGRINNAFAMQVPLALLFEYPTIATFAQQLEQLQLKLMINADNLEAMLKELEQNDGSDKSN